jgi:hypothetical protein
MHMTRLLALLLFSALSLPALAADIYRWTDETGRVNYGNVVPEQFKSAARKIDTAGAVVATTPRGQTMPGPVTEPSSSVGSSTRPAGAPPPGVGYSGVGY